jgi:ABC-type glycerol-3-phosphate transport system substrate-binding protein
MSPSLGERMKTTAAVAALITGLTLAACGQNTPPPAKPTSTTSTTSPSPSPAAKTEAKHETPDTHGMPGMSELVKGEEKKAPDGSEKK